VTPLRVGGSSLVGAACAVGMIVGLGWPSAPHATPLEPPRLSARENKQHLSGGQLAALFAWASRYRSCAERRGVALAAPTVGENEVVLTGRAGRKITQRQFRRALPCALELGAPPQLADFSLMADRHLHLFKPRACLLPVTKGPT
jgi:hypothetical protein